MGQQNDQNEQHVDLDELEKSATELLGAATLMKGFNLDSGSHQDERGEVQNKVPGPGDAGGVDALQIVGRAKIAKALKDTGLDDDMVGKLVAKMFGDEASKSQLPGDLVKAAVAAAGAPAAPPAGAPVNVEAILSELFAGTAQAIGNVQANHGQFAKAQIDFNGKLAKAVVQSVRESRETHQLMKSIAAKLGVKIEQMDRAPVAAPKSQLQAGNAQPLAKGNGDGTAVVAPNGAAGGVPPQLSRRQLGSVLSYMGLAKGIKFVNGTDNTLTKSNEIYGGGTFEEGVLREALGWLAAHPNEAQKALTFGDTP
jgi:hypothetical protein